MPRNRGLILSLLLFLYGHVAVAALYMQTSQANEHNRR